MTSGEEQLGDYAILGAIGSGGFGSVYLARGSQGQLRAIKVLAQPGEDSRRRLHAEAAAMARVSSPNCVRVYELIDTGGTLALVTDFIEGASLRAVLREHGRLSGPQALAVLSGALNGLAAVHAAGLVHADIKPDNILIDRSGTSRLIDFGLAEPVGQAQRDDVVSGSPTYMSPERIHGGPIDGRSDLYAMGVLLYELLSGKRPFTGATPHEMLEQHLTAPVPDLRSVVPEVGDGLANLCRSAMQKNPADRPQTAVAFLVALEEAARERYGDAWVTAGVGASLGGMATAILGTAGTISGSAVAGGIAGVAGTVGTAGTVGSATTAAAGTSAGALSGGGMAGASPTASLAGGGIPGASSGTQLVGGLHGGGQSAPLAGNMGGGASSAVGAGSQGASTNIAGASAHSGSAASGLGTKAAVGGGRIARAFHALTHSAPAMTAAAVGTIAAVVAGAVIITANNSADDTDLAVPVGPSSSSELVTTTGEGTALPSSSTIGASTPASASTAGAGAPGSTPASPTAPAASSGTQMITVNPLSGPGKIKDHLLVESWNFAADTTCYPSSVGTGLVYTCGSTADDKPACWPETRTTVWCLESPTSATVYRGTVNPLEDKPSTGDRPWLVELADGTSCRYRLGGAPPRRPDDLIYFYWCGEGNSAIVGEQNGTPFDTSKPTWSALVAIGDGPATPTDVAKIWVANNPFPINGSASTSTEMIDVTPLASAGQLKPGLTVKKEDFGGENTCTTSRVATGAVYECGSHALYAPACWLKDVKTVWCLRLPTDTEVIEATVGSLPPDPANEGSAWQVELTDGTQCRIRLGGVGPQRTDDYNWAYTCGADSILVVGPDNQPFDVSGPLWTAKRTAPTGGAPPVETVTVAKVWSAVNQPVLLPDDVEAFEIMQRIGCDDVVAVDISRPYGEEEGVSCVGDGQEITVARFASRSAMVSGLRNIYDAGPDTDGVWAIAGDNWLVWTQSPVSPDALIDVAVTKPDSLIGIRERIGGELMTLADLMSG